MTQSKLSSQQEILQYLFEHEELGGFVKKIASEGKNLGAERPYVVKSAGNYVVVEGNTRIAAYKVLTGQLVAPAEFAALVPDVSAELKKSLESVDCSIAPSRDALLPIMANAHFGLGDKSKWGYLGSRKAVYDEWNVGKTIPQLARFFDRTEGQVRELILEYLLYQKALAIAWTKEEKAVLLNPSVQFNPPVRFLQTSGHKEKVGISYDSTNLKIVYEQTDTEHKFKHLLMRLVISPKKGLGATASYEDVFKDYVVQTSAGAAGVQAPGSGGASGASSSASSGNAAASASGSASTTSGAAATSPAGASTSKLKANALFAYPVTINSGLVQQLMKEAGEISCKKFPASATFLLRNVVESILKDVIDKQKANAASKLLDLQGSISLCMSNAVTLPPEDKKVLKEFQKNYVSYLNLGSHGNVIPNPDMVVAARDCIDQFVKRNV